MLRFLRAKWFYLLLIVICIAGIIISLGFPTSAGRHGIAMDFFPKLVFGAIILLSIVMLFRKGGFAADITVSYSKMAIVVGMMLAAILIMQYINGLLGIFLFLTAYRVIIGKKPLSKSALIAAAGTAVIAIPVHLLHIPL